MTGQPINLAAVRAVQERCARLHLTAQASRAAKLAAIRAMDAGASAAHAYAAACDTIRSATRASGFDPRGAA
ncbi:MAG TPA: hypothetical protein DCM32_05085 [Xanthomonadaceae bacterium]|jgi:alkylation response protein AidB-like acyl-CoA dehydrogenase|nr:hypothetical protein [Xanthomonadaceae bacterium]